MRYFEAIFEGFKLTKDILCEDLNTEQVLNRARTFKAMDRDSTPPGEREAAKRALQNLIKRVQDEKNLDANFLRTFNSIINGTDTYNPRAKLHPHPDQEKPKAKPQPEPKKSSEKPKNIFSVGDFVTWKYPSEKYSAEKELGQVIGLKGTRAVFVRWLVGPRAGKEQIVETMVLRTADPKNYQNKNSNDSKAKEEKAKRQQDRADREDAEWRGDKEEQRFKVLAFARFVDDKSNKVYGVFSQGGDYATFWGKYKGSLAKKYMTQREAIEIFAKKLDKGYKNVPVNDQITKMVKDSLR